MPKKRAPRSSDPLWFKDAVIYETHIKAFADSDGDGVGDFRGMIGKLDYLQNLGVTAIWLLPFYPSPLRDDGYDIADYFNINPAYGTLRDFKAFLREAHERGLRVITELVLNHTSDQNPWFQASRRAKPGSPEREMYVWSDTPERYLDARIIFQDFETSNWTWDPVARAYYWHRFYSHQPDLNFENPKVHEMLFKVIDFWFGMGIDGLRLDAVPYLYEQEGTNCENLPATHAFLKKLRAHIDAKFQDRMLLAEANQWPEDAVAYFGASKDGVLVGDECHMCFHFPVMPRMFMAIQMEDRFPIIDILDQTPVIPENCQWGMFLRNHDELTLEMVTDEERDYMYRVYATDPRARINLGIRRRLAPLMLNNRRKIELINILLLSLPGTPILYYGDEIGMGDNIFLGDRNGVRTPMQWSSDRNAGFSDANPQQLYLPVTIDPEYHYETVNVENQERNVSSLLWWTRRVIAMRKRFKAFGRGSIEFLYPENAKILAFIRRYEDEAILVVVNLSRFSQVVELDLSAWAGFTPTEVFSQNQFPLIKETPYLLTLSAYDHHWLALSQSSEVAHMPESRPRPELTGPVTWTWLSGAKGRAYLEKDVLPGYMQHCRWFGGKARSVRVMKIRDFVKLSGDVNGGRLALVDVAYTDGHSETYALPVQIARGDIARRVRQDFPQAVIAQFDGGEDTVVYDAIFEPQFRAALFRAMQHRKSSRGEHGAVIGEVSRAFRERLPSGEAMASTVLRAEQSNTSVLYGSDFFLKLYRRLDEGVNPDVEITRFLTDYAGFNNVPAYVGSVAYKGDKSEPRVLAMAEVFTQNQGDAWTMTLDIVGQFFERVLTEKPPLGSYTLPRLVDRDTRLEYPAEFLELTGGALAEQVRRLGERTAEMHLALASNRSDSAFAPEPYNVLYQRSVYQSMRNMLRRTFQLLNRTIPSLTESVRADAALVCAREKELLERVGRLIGRKIDANRIRIHGDYHLGQVLHTGRDFVIIDFEGEPARALSERRIKRSAMRDVAGMLRSYHYAVHTALHQQVAVRGSDVESIIPWADCWYEYVSRGFLHAYLARAGDADFVPDNPDDLEVVLDACLLDKAVYEVAYELNNRPDWLIVPLRGIIQILNR